MIKQTLPLLPRHERSSLTRSASEEKASLALRVGVSAFHADVIGCGGGKNVVRVGSIRVILQWGHEPAVVRPRAEALLTITVAAATSVSDAATACSAEPHSRPVWPQSGP